MLNCDYAEYGHVPQTAADIFFHLFLILQRIDPNTFTIMVNQSRLFAMNSPDECQVLVFARREA